MYLKKIHLTNFKNYADEEFEFSPYMNCIVGNNGVGKTNVLDAISYLSNCKSFISTNDNKNIKHGEDFFAIKGNFINNDDVDVEILCAWQKDDGKQMKINSKKYERLIDHIGLYPIVIISPYDIDIINETSDVRRKFIDSVISQYNKTYLENLVAYNHILYQRNRLLKEPPNNILLDVLDEKLVQYGVPIHLERIDFFSKFIPDFKKHFTFIANSDEEPDIVYQSQLSDSDSFLDQLHINREKDIAMQYSTCGIHKDNMDMLINGFPVKRFASQGQQKSFTISIRLAQFDIIKNIKSFAPILLLDDIFDKIDTIRVGKLMRKVCSQEFNQVFITDTGKTRLQNIIPESAEYKSLEL